MCIARYQYEKPVAWSKLVQQDIGNWDVSNVTNMNRMFKKASAFDQDISNWEVGNVNRMTQMFESATLFNQDLSNWCVKLSI